MNGKGEWKSTKKNPFESIARGRKGVVLFPNFSLTPFKTLEHSSRGRGNTVVGNIEGE